MLHGVKIQYEIYKSETIFFQDFYCSSGKHKVYKILVNGKFFNKFEFLLCLNCLKSKMKINCQLIIKGIIKDPP